MCIIPLPQVFFFDQKVNNTQCHLSYVRAELSYHIFFDTFSCRIHWSACCSRACTSTQIRERALGTEVGKVYKEFVIDDAICNAFVCLHPDLLKAVQLAFQSLNKGCRKSECPNSFGCKQFGGQFGRERVAFDEVACCFCLFFGPLPLSRSCPHFPYHNTRGTGNHDQG